MKDKSGNPYILHPLRLMVKAESDVEKIAAVLHDTVEDTPETFDSLMEKGISPQAVKIIKYLTRGEDESYEKFILRIQDNPSARRVKLLDIEDNLDMTRLLQMTEKDMNRVNRYLKARKILLGAALD